MILRNIMGMAVARPGKAMSDGDWINDTRLEKLTVDLDQTEPHLRLFELRGGTKWSVVPSSVSYIEETIFSMKHNMPFKPKFLCFFYTVDTPVGFGANIGAYTQNHAYMLYNAFGIGEEGLYAYVDETHFYIKHFFETFGFGGASFTAYGSDYLFRIKFEILNQPAFYFGDKGY